MKIISGLKLLKQVGLIQRSSHITCIDHKFLESGHTQMEVDSIHSAVEHAKKCTNIYVTSQWDTVMQMARRSHPYVVIPMKYWDFEDLKTMTASHFRAMKFDQHGKRINWLQIKWVRVTKDQPDCLQCRGCWMSCIVTVLKMEDNQFP